MATRPKKASKDAPPKKRWGSPFHFWTNPAVREAFDRFIASHQYRPKENDVLEKFLIKQLGDNGYWTVTDQKRFDDLDKTRPKRGRRPKKG